MYQNRTYLLYDWDTIFLKTKIPRQHAGGFFLYYIKNKILFRISVSLAYLFPINHIPKSTNILRPLVLIF